MPSTSTRPSSNIPLETLPFLNTRHTSNDDIITNQPAIGRRTPTGDDDDDEEADEEPNGDVDEEVGLNQQRRRQRRRRRRHAPSITTPTTANIEPEWRLHLYNLLERPNSSAAAVLVHVLVTGLIAFSALVTILETVPAFHSLPGGIWFGLETSLVALFTVEYVARCAATSYSWSALFAWIGSFFGIMDLLAILPYYIEIALQKDTSTLFRFSILRTFRLLRVFRPFRYNNALLLTIEVMYLSFRRSKDALLALGFFVLMVVVVFSTLLYFIERGKWDDTLETFINSDGDPSQFASIPAAAWFVIVTISTVGYGEITPRSFLGRLITLPLLVFGLLLIALPSFVLGREFSVVWNEMTNGQTPRTPYALSGQGHAQSELFLHNPTFLSRIRARAHSLDESPVTTIAAATAREGNEIHGGPNQSHNALAAQLSELRAAMNAQNVLLTRILERDTGVSGRDN